MSSTRPAAVIVLAAGEGTRMKSATPKVLHAIGGRSMLGHALAAARALDPEHLVVVVRHERDQVAAHVAEIDPDALIADQDEVKGTGRAVAVRPRRRCPRPLDRHRRGHLRRRPAARRRRRCRRWSHATRRTATPSPCSPPSVADPTGYGRILRDADGDVAGIVEHKDADDGAAARSARSTPASTPSTPPSCADALGRDRHRQRAGRDVPHRRPRHRARGRAPGRAPSSPTTSGRSRASTTGSSSPRSAPSSTAASSSGWMRAGVTVVDPATTWIDVTVELAPRRHAPARHPAARRHDGRRGAPSSARTPR